MELKSYKNNIIYNYLFTFISSLNFTQGYWMIYLATRGFSLVELGIFEGIFHTTSVIMETPTGAIADVFGRKISRIIGRVMIIIHHLLLISSDNFFLIGLAFVICALGYNFESGAREAFVYDSLIEDKNEKKYMKIEGIGEALFQTATAVALVLGGIFALKNNNLPFLLTAMVSLISIIPLLAMKETTVNKNKKERLTFKESVIMQYVNSFKTLKDNKILMRLILTFSLFATFVTVSFYYTQNRWFELGFKENQIGLFLALQCIFSAFGGILAHKVESKLGRKNVLLVIPSLIVLSLFGMIFKNTSILAMVSLGILDSIFYVVISDYMNRLIESDKRATLISMSSMFFSISMILIFPIFGIIGDIFTLKTSFTSLFSFGFIIYIYYLINFKKMLD